MQTEKFMLRNIAVNVSADHRFGTDAFLLASFAKPKPKDTVCDLCTGCGIIPLIFCKDKPPAKIYGVELQPEAAELFRLSAEENGLSDRLFPICADLRGELPIPAGSVDMVTVNPPYFKADSGEKKLSEAQKIARHELCCNLSDVISAADRLLKYGGTLKICHLPERLTDLLVLMREHKIEPKLLRFVQNRDGEAPWLVLVGGKKGAKPGIKTEPSLIMEQGGEYARELQEMYK